MEMLSTLQPGDVGVIVHVDVPRPVQETCCLLQITPGTRFQVISCWGSMVLRFTSRIVVLGKHYAGLIEVIKLNTS